MTINVTTDPADSFWDKTYGHVPFSFSSYGYRPFFAQWLNSFAAYNSYETKWGNDTSKQATKLVYKAAATFDPEKRKEIAFQAQKLPLGRRGLYRLVLQGADRRALPEGEGAQGVRVPVPRVVPLLGCVARVTEPALSARDAAGR